MAEDTFVKYYTVNPKPARKCDRCGVVVGPDAPLKAGIIVKDGPTTGFFHNHQCFQMAKAEMDKAREEKKI